VLFFLKINFMFIWSIRFDSYIYIYGKKSWECICRTFLGLKERWQGIFSARAIFFYKKSLSKNERKVKARTTRVIKKINLFIPTFWWKTFHVITYLKKTTRILHWKLVVISFSNINPIPIK
jgi:hypothetical protein